MTPMTPATPVGTEAANRVAEAARHLWASAGEAPEVHSWSEIATSLGQDADSAISAAVVVSRLKRMECVISSTADTGLAGNHFSGLIAKGWEVSALLPIKELGAGHESFRGISMNLQGWWQRSDGQLKFTAPERA